MHIDTTTLKLVLGTKSCLCTIGHHPGHEVRARRCPNEGLAQRGKACEHCGSKTKHGHRVLSYDAVGPCNDCHGTLLAPESTGDYMPHDVFAAVTVRVFRHSRPAALSHAMSSSGWANGELAKLSDAELVAKVREGSRFQALHFVRDDGTLLHCAVVVGRHGYSVCGIDPSTPDDAVPPPDTRTPAERQRAACQRWPVARLRAGAAAGLRQGHRPVRRCRACVACWDAWRRAG